MALGRNLKRQPLIPDSEPKKGEKKAPARNTGAEPNSPTATKVKKAPKKPVKKKPVAKKSAKKSPSAMKAVEKEQLAIPSQAVQEDTPKASKRQEVEPPVVDAPIAPKQTTEPTQPEQTTKTETPPPTEAVSPAQQPPVYQPPAMDQSPAIRQQEVTVVSQRDYKKRLQLKNKFDAEIRALQGRKLLLIVFKLGGQEFAIEIDKTKEVVKTPDIAPMPHLPEHMVGVANVRGKVVLIMDLGRKFHISNGASQWEDPYSIVIQNAGYKIGLLVPEVPNTIMVEGSDISTAAGIVTDTARDETYIKGIVKQEGRMIFFLDIQELVEGNKVSVVPDMATA